MASQIVGGIWNVHNQPYGEIRNAYFSNPFNVTIGSASSYTDHIYKAVIPNFLYKPPYGYPLGKDVPEIRRLAATPFVSMVTNTLADEVAALPWDIKAREGEEVPEEILKKTKQFFYNPNRNDESINDINCAFIRDLLELDAGVLVKIRNLKDEFLELYNYDGGTFTKNCDIHGVLPEVNAYYQYGWNTGARPTPFNKNEIVYGLKNKRADSLYGRSPVEVLLEVLQLLLYGIQSNLEYFTDNNIPKGVLKIIGANQKSIDAFRTKWQEQLKRKDEAGNWKRLTHHMPIINTEGDFIRIGFSNADLELISQQKWFTKIVWACFQITPSELGFTEDSNRSVDINQSKVTKRKAVEPYSQKIEYLYNTQVINDLPWIVGKYEDKVIFEFDHSDVQEELVKRQIYWGDIKHGVVTVNEVREELNKEPLEEPEPPAMDKFKQAGNLQDFLKDYGNDNQENGPGVKLKALDSSAPLDLGAFEKIANPEFLKKKVSVVVSEWEKIVLDLLKKEVGKNTIAEIKAVDNAFIKRIAGLLSFEGLQVAVVNTIKANFLIGVDKVETEIGMNFVPNKAAIDFLSGYTFENIKGLGEELKQDLRQELQRGLMNGEGIQELSKRVRKVADVGKVRADAIARTETNRAENLGSLDAWRQSKLPMEKEWVAALDARTSEMCKTLNGTRIGLNEKFEYKGQFFDSPPGHVNCRSTLNFYRVQKGKA